MDLLLDPPRDLSRKGSYCHVLIHIYLSFFLCVYLSFCLSVFLSVYLSVYLPVYLPIHLSICLIYLLGEAVVSLCSLSLSLSLSLSVSVSCRSMDPLSGSPCRAHAHLLNPFQAGCEQAAGNSPTAEEQQMVARLPARK